MISTSAKAVTATAAPTLLLEQLQGGLHLLWKASLYALDVQKDRWLFAVEIEEMRRAGLSHNDLRWLIHKGFVAHGVETPSTATQERCFEFSAELGSRSCFVLTPAGDVMSEAVLSSRHSPASHRVPADQAKPSWHRDKRELWFGEQLVKRFRAPAPNQILVLAAFEEESWPLRIDDPLPPSPQIDGKRRLHDTVNALNRFQSRWLVRFRGDGSGEGVQWEIVANTSLDYAPTPTSPAR